jgi:hypothetical protein
VGNHCVTSRRELRCAQLNTVRRSVIKGQPYGSAPWMERMATQWNLDATLRERRRPMKQLTNNGSDTFSRPLPIA